MANNIVFLVKSDYDEHILVQSTVEDLKDYIELISGHMERGDMCDIEITKTVMTDEEIEALPAAD